MRVLPRRQNSGFEDFLPNGLKFVKFGETSAFSTLGFDHGRISRNTLAEFGFSGDPAMNPIPTRSSSEASLTIASLARRVGIKSTNR